VFNLRRDITYLRQYPQIDGSKTDSASKWTLATGQLIVDIKSTHLVKFDEDAWSHAHLADAARLFVDIELVEKLVIHARALANISLSQSSRFYLYAKHVNLLDVRALALADMRVGHESRVSLYVEELTASWCVQRDVFARMLLEGAGASFNLSVINSKSVQLMRDAFSAVRVEHADARLFVGVFTMPSWLLLHADGGQYYEKFVRERVDYLWPTRHDVLAAADNNAVIGPAAAAAAAAAAASLAANAQQDHAKLVNG
jgi:hypothetical protein